MADAKGVRATHGDYDHWKDPTERCRDGYQGLDAVRAQTTKYLPQMKMSASEYVDYLGRAQWSGAPERTVRGLAGAVMRNEAQVVVPERVRRDLQADATQTGLPLQRLIQNVIQEQLKVGRIGVLVDRSTSGSGRPYMRTYTAESITNWDEAEVDGRKILTLVVLREKARDRRQGVCGDGAPDIFDWTEQDQYRVYWLGTVEGAGRSRLIVDVWRKVNAASAREEDQWRPVLELRQMPDRRGEALDFIPFTFCGSDDVDPAIEKPPLLDLADTALGWYRNSADYERAVKYLCPVFVFHGTELAENTIISPGQAFGISDAGGGGQILQMSKDTVSGYVEAMDRKLQMMAVQGARLLETQKAMAETAESKRLGLQGEGATLNTIALTADQALTRALRQYVWWTGEGTVPEDLSDVLVATNKDFVDVKLTPDQLRAYMELHQSGKISYETFYHLLERGETTRPGVGVEDERELIEAEEEEALATAGNRLDELALEVA